MQSMKLALVALGQKAIVGLLVIGVLSCGQTPPSEGKGQSAPARSAVFDQTSGAAEDSPGLVVLGDSLTAGLGLAANESYPALLQDRLNAQNYQVRIVNAGVSGDTSAGGLRRLDWALDERTSGLLLALGGNDGLRGLPVEEMKANLGEIITIARNRNIEVLLAGMEAPPNFGELYTSEFREVFHELAREQADPRRWEEPLIGQIEASRREVLSLERLPERQQWRDRWLAQIVKAKRKIRESVGR